MTTLAVLRARGLTVSGGLKLRVAGPAAVVADVRPLLEGGREELLDALQDEAEDEIAQWPLAYRRWLVRTVAYCLGLGYVPTEAFWASYRDIRSQYAEHRAHVAILAPDQQMLAAALDFWPARVGEGGDASMSHRHARET